jgi:membrane protein YdbS with pleckstrin-like domain
MNCNFVIVIITARNFFGKISYYRINSLVKEKDCLSLLWKYRVEIEKQVNSTLDLFRNWHQVSKELYFKEATMQHYLDRAFIERHPLSPKKIWKKMAVASIALLFIVPVFTAGISILFTTKDFVETHAYTLLMIMVCMYLCLLVVDYFYEKAYIKRYYYNVTDTLLIIRKGVIAKKEITVPFERIQDVYLDQDIFDALFDLYDVHISTATTTSTERAHIDGVERHTAEAIRTLILSKLHG